MRAQPIWPTIDDDDLTTRLLPRILIACTLCALISRRGFHAFAQEAQQKRATGQAARPQRTEAEVRALAEKHRQERARLRQETGKPVELIADYVAANARVLLGSGLPGK